MKADRLTHLNKKRWMIAELKDGQVDSCPCAPEANEDGETLDNLKLG